MENSSRTAPVFGPIMDTRNPHIREMLEGFVNLQSLILYTIGTWHAWHVDEYLGALFLSVPDLTLLIHSSSQVLRR